MIKKQYGWEDQMSSERLYKGENIWYVGDEIVYVILKKREERKEQAR